MLDVLTASKDVGLGPGNVLCVANGPGPDVRAMYALARHEASAVQPPQKRPDFPSDLAANVVLRA